MKSRNYLIMSLLLTSLACFGEKPILLTSPVLKIIDGIKGLMDENNIHKIIYMGQQVNKFQYGTVDSKTKERIAQYEFQGKKYTLKELTLVEENLKKLNDQESNKELVVLLNKLKNNYLALIKPFFADARGAQQQMSILIKESCSKRNRHDSLLLNWSGENEEESFKKNVSSIKALDALCTDVTNFLKDLLYSCPKAVAKFKEWNKKQKPQNAIK